MPNRRDFLASAAALSLALGGCARETTVAASSRPNVLMVAIDDLNDWVGFLGGHPQVQTPNLDRLAAQSVVFERAYCNSPLCHPSRSSALSGLFPHQTGVYDNNTSLSLANPAAVTLTNWMAQQGYTTSLHGKIYHWISGPIYPDPLPATTPATNLQCSGAPNLPPKGLFDWGEVTAAEAEMANYRYYQDGKSFLESMPAAPFFLGVGFDRSHVPWYVPKEFLDLYPAGQTYIPPVPLDDLSDVPPAGVALALSLNHHACITRQNLWESAVRGYLAAISFVDRQVGRLLAALDASPYANNTIVVLWSDQGFHLGEKFHWHKFALWERATRIPFLIRMPGGAIPAARVASAVSLVDLYPTLLDLCGLANPPGALSGRSLVPLLTQPNRAWDVPVLSTWLQGNHAVRSNRWRYIRYADGSEELYDHYFDENEWTNLASNPGYASVVSDLKRHIPL